jgi:hypothetical protein
MNIGVSNLTAQQHGGEPAEAATPMRLAILGGLRRPLLPVANDGG